MQAELTSLEVKILTTMMLSVDTDECWWHVPDDCATTVVPRSFIAEAVGVSPSTVGRYQTSLCAKGHITKRRHSNGRRGYLIRCIAPSKNNVISLCEERAKRRAMVAA